MFIKIKVRLSSGKPKIEKYSEKMYLAHVRAGTQNDATEELLIVLPKYFGTPQSRISCVSGRENEEKMFEIQ